MRATTCEKSVTVKIVLLLDEQQLSLKIDDGVLTKMFGDVISIDDKILAHKLPFLENFVSRTILTLNLFQILTCRILMRCIQELHVWRYNSGARSARSATIIIQNSSSPSSPKNLDLRPCGRPYKVPLLACAANCTVGSILATT